jgi:hypothetical protein
MSTVRDLRREHFSDLPEPVPETKVKHEILGDKYMDALERYINQLSQHVRKIQDEELMVTNQFSLALSSLQTKSHDKRRMREDVAREVYQKKIAKIREKRKRFREMLYDAQSERKKLIDSMQIQKDEDDILRRKLAKLSALTAAETSREQRQTSKFDKFALLFMLLQVMLFIIYGLAFDFSADATSYNARGAPGSGSVQPVAPIYQFFTDIMLMAVVGFGFLFAFLRKYSYSAIGFTLLTVAFAFQWGVIVMNFLNSLVFNSLVAPDTFEWHNVQPVAGRPARRHVRDDHRADLVWRRARRRLGVPAADHRLLRDHSLRVQHSARRAPPALLAAAVVDVWLWRRLDLRARVWRLLWPRARRAARPARQAPRQGQGRQRRLVQLGHVRHDRHRFPLGALAVVQRRARARRAAAPRHCQLGARALRLVRLRLPRLARLPRRQV